MGHGGESVTSVDGFDTERLVVRELEDDDLEAILEIYLSNPDYLLLTEGSDAPSSKATRRGSRWPGQLAFEPVATRKLRMAAGEAAVMVLEREL